MGKDHKLAKESASIIEEVEEQLNKILQDKKAQVHRELDEKIRMEKEEAEKRISLLEEEVSEEKQSLAQFRSVFSEYESTKENLRTQIKEHLDKAIRYQTEIETMTSQTLEELKVVHTMNQKLEEVNRQSNEQISGMKRNIEEKFGIIAPIPERNGHDDMDYNLEMELSKLNKIKDLLTGTETVIPEPTESAEPETQPEMTEPFDEPSAEFDAGEAETPFEEAASIDVEYLASGTPETDSVDEILQPEAGSAPNDEPEVEMPEGESIDETTSLDAYRKSEHVEGNGEIKYFVHGEHIVLDPQAIFHSLEHSLEEAKSLYMKLSDLDSPKEQFFVKQDIIRHQDELRKMMLSYVRIAEKEHCTFPSGLNDVMNLDMLKEILEKVSMENWSNEKDYQAFEQYIMERRAAFSERIDQSPDAVSAIREELRLMD